MNPAAQIDARRLGTMCIQSRAAGALEWSDCPSFLWCERQGDRFHDAVNGDLRMWRAAGWSENHPGSPEAKTVLETLLKLRARASARSSVVFVQRQLTSATISAKTVDCQRWFFKASPRFSDMT